MERAMGSGPAALVRFPQGVLASDNVVPVVLEFEQPPVAVYKSRNPQADADKYRDELAKSHREFLENLAGLGLNVQLGQTSMVVADPSGPVTMSQPHDFTLVFNGVGVLMPGRMVTQVASMPGLRAVTLNSERPYLLLDNSVPFSEAPKVWERKVGEVAVRGDGMRVAIIDTGVDWTHPAFGGFAEAPNEKVVHAVSFTGEAPQDNFGHGTHVAAIVAADPDYKGTPRGDSKLAGMAPKAQLMGYKVLTASGSGSSTNIILAMEDAVRRGAHVMNLSLGDSYGDPYSPESSAANNAMLAGVVACIAAGNSGPEANTVGAPGAAHHVITVGASTDSGVTALIAQFSAEGQPDQDIEMRLMEGSAELATPALEIEYVPCGMGLGPEDFPSEVAGKIALIQRGEITFREKALFAEKAGAQAAVVYNNRDGNFFGSLGEEEGRPSVPAITISKADGEMMLQHASGYATLKLNPDLMPQPYRLAEFSSRGPNNDGWIKPELTAPGVNILSATILEAAFPGGGMPDPSGYTEASGTSMATPHVAGAAALIRQAHPEWTPLQIKAALVNTARWMDEQGGVMDQGNGAMDLLKAMDARAILVTVDDPHGPTHSFGQVVSSGQEVKVTKQLTIQTLPGYDQVGTYRLSVEIPNGPDGLQADLSAGSISCSAGACVAAFDLTLTADGETLADGVYYGFVVAEGDEGQAMRLPFHYEAVKEAGGKPEPQRAERKHRLGLPRD